VAKAHGLRRGWSLSTHGTAAKSGCALMTISPSNGVQMFAFAHCFLILLKNEASVKTLNPCAVVVEPPDLNVPSVAVNWWN
jgi:hypothetical protein